MKMFQTIIANARPKMLFHVHYVRYYEDGLCVKFYESNARLINMNEVTESPNFCKTLYFHAQPYSPHLTYIGQCSAPNFLHVRYRLSNRP